MLKYIESLRTKPKQVRSAYAFWTAFLVAVCIALIWSSGVSKRFSTQENVLTQAPPKEEVTSSLSRVLTDVKERLASSLALFRTKTIYQKEEEKIVIPTNTLDLEALFASSTQAKTKAKEQATTTSTLN